MSCHIYLGEYQKALLRVNEALKEFPQCTDYEYLRADILHKCKRFTLAIESLEKCLSMGAPPVQLEFSPGCGNYRAAYQLGELYFGLEDYVRAFKYFDLALSQKPGFYLALYRLGAALNQLLQDKDEVRAKLFSHFSPNPRYAPNVLLGADILVGEGLYGQALQTLEEATDTAGREMELAYVRGRALFFQQQSGEARALLETVCQTPEPAERVLNGMRPLSALMLFALGLMQNDAELLTASLADIQAYCGSRACGAAKLMQDIFLQQPEQDPQFAEEGATELTIILQILDLLLKCRRLELFEQMLHALNYIDSKNVLLRLAQLYDANHLTEMAAEYALRSIKELDYLDVSGADILFRQIV